MMLVYDVGTRGKHALGRTCSTAHDRVAPPFGAVPALAPSTPCRTGSPSGCRSTDEQGSHIPGCRTYDRRTDRSGSHRVRAATPPGALEPSPCHPTRRRTRSTDVGRSIPNSHRVRVDRPWHGIDRPVSASRACRCASRCGSGCRTILAVMTGSDIRPPRTTSYQNRTIPVGIV